MANEVVEKGGVFGGRVGLVNADQLKKAMAESASKDPRGGGPDGSDYMNFSGKRNVYEIGVEKRDTTADELWLVNVASFEDGYVCWKAGRPIATRLVPIGQPVPEVDFNEHGPFPQDGDGWYQAKALVLRSLDAGQQVYFKINSVSGVSVIAALQKEITDRLIGGQPCWPVVSLGRETFTAKGYKNGKPVITIDGWLNDGQMGALAEVFADPEAEIDLDTLYEEAMTSGPALVEGEKTEAPAKARRTRRAS